MQHRILELYSGIGGMHCAWNESGLNGEIVAAVDINNVANSVYQHNFHDTLLLSRNIQSLSIKNINKFEINTILMSPPCQPFTRNGKQLALDDPRTDSFFYIINILHQLNNVKYILMENVKGFEISNVRHLFVNKLNECNFDFQEFLLCPTSVGVPNSRLRYYCIARKRNTSWKFQRKDEIITNLPKNYGMPYNLETILESNVSEQFILNEKFLKRGNVIDVCYKGVSRSCCFTKAYSHYLEGSGSVYTDASKEDVKKYFEEANQFENGSEAFIQALKKLRLRFFTPKEILSLMSFPDNYTFPENITVKQCYRLLGNSINVKVTSELIKILFSNY